MHLLDIRTSTTKGEIATSSLQTPVTFDPFSLKNNFQLHFVQPSSQPQLSAPLLSWTSRNFTMTFAYPYPLILFLLYISRLLPTQNGLLTRAVYFVITIGFSYRTLQTSDSKSFKTSMITYLQDTLGRTRLLKQSVVIMFGLISALSFRNSVVLVPLADGPNLCVTNPTDF